MLIRAVSGTLCRRAIRIGNVHADEAGRVDGWVVSVMPLRKLQVRDVGAEGVDRRAACGRPIWIYVLLTGGGSGTVTEIGGVFEVDGVRCRVGGGGVNGSVTCVLGCAILRWAAVCGTTAVGGGLRALLLGISQGGTLG